MLGVPHEKNTVASLKIYTNKTCLVSESKSEQRVMTHLGDVTKLGCDIPILLHEFILP